MSTSLIKKNTKKNGKVVLMLVYVNIMTNLEN